MTVETHQSATELVIDQNSGHGKGGVNLLFSSSAIIAAFFAVFLFVYNFSLNRTVTSLEVQKASLLSEIQTPDNQKLEQTINSTASAIGQLQSLFSSRTYTVSDFLTNFTKLVNKTAMVTNLALDEEDNLRLDGQANGMSSLAILLQSLEDSEYLENVTLVGISNESSNNVPVTRFSISAYLNRDKAEAAQEKAKEKSSFSNSTDQVSESNLADPSAESSVDSTTTEVPNITSDSGSEPNPF